VYETQGSSDSEIFMLTHTHTVNLSMGPNGYLVASKHTSIQDV